MKIYLAAPYALRDSLDHVLRSLEAHGFECTSTWLEADHEITPAALGTSPGSGDDYATQHVARDIEDVLRSDALLLITWSASERIAEFAGVDLGPNSGGRHVETGVAMGANIPVVVYGAPENIFHRGALALRSEFWEGVIQHLYAIRRNAQADQPRQG